MTTRNSFIRVLYSAILIWLSAVAPIAAVNMLVTDQAARTTVVARTGTETKDLHTIGAMLSTRVSSDTFSRAWAESSSRVWRMPLSTLLLFIAGMVTALVLSLMFCFKARDAVYRLARLQSRRRFLLLPAREGDRQRLAWRLLAMTLPIGCLVSMLVGLGIAWETGFAWTIDVLDGTIAAAVIGACSLAFSLMIASCLVECSSRAGEADPVRRWHCSRCAYEIGTNVPLGCPECGAGMKDESVPLQATKPLYLPRLGDIWRERPIWLLTFVTILVVVGGVQWTIRQAQTVRAALAGPLHIATRWQGVTRVRWDDGTQAVFAQGYFSEDGPLMDSTQFSHNSYRRVATCAWAPSQMHADSETWDIAHWVSPWFEVGASVEIPGASRHRVVLVSPGSAGCAGEAWLSPRSVSLVEQYDRDAIQAEGTPAIVKRVWKAHLTKALEPDG